MDSTITVAELPAARGFGWLVDAFRLFARRPFPWIGLCAGWLVISFGLFIVPFIGPVIMNFLQPAFFASFAIAAFRQVAGEPVLMGDLFSGFRRNFRALVNLGAIMLIAEIAIFALMAVLGLPLMSPPEQQGVTVQEFVESLRGKEWTLLVGFILTVIVKGALWFAPPLIAFHDMPTAHAMRWSVYAALANLGAMLLYGLVLCAGFMLGMLTWFIGFIVVLPVMAVSTFVGYREVFEGRAPVPSSPA
ncbi:MAG: BPSS1780 family membrane protein [Bacillota bacterium]